jgi:hypothetical protein
MSAKKDADSKLLVDAREKLTEQAKEKVEGEILEYDNPIKIECGIDGHDNDYLLFKRKGWKFKHLRQWESTPGVEGLVELLLERLVGWKMTDEDGNDIPFVPLAGLEETEESKKDSKIEPIPEIETFDELSPVQAAWVVTGFRMAYYQSSMPDPNS